MHRNFTDSSRTAEQLSGLNVEMSDEIQTENTGFSMPNCTRRRMDCGKCR